MFKNRAIRLPTYLAETPAWKDYADVVASVYDTYVDLPLAQHKDALNVNAFHPTWVAAKRGTDFLSFTDYTYGGQRWVSEKNRIRAAALLGYAFSDASKLGEDTIELLVNSGAQFLPFQGKPEFVDFLNYVLDASLDVQTLWCNELRAGAQLSTYTEDFANAIWTKNAVTVTSDVAYGPNGVETYGQTVDRIYETTATSAHSVSRAYSALSVNSAYAASRYILMGERSWVYVTMNNGTTSASAWINVDTNIVGTNTGLTNLRAFPQGAGWFRISASYMTAVAGTTMTVTWGLSTGDSITSYTGVATNSLYMFGDQFEAGISASEYSYMAAPGSNIVTTATYGSLLPEGSANIGTPVYQGGSWFPTTHVDVTIIIDPSRASNLAAFKDFFKFVAPINLVLRNVVFANTFTFNPIQASAAFRMNVFDVVST